MQVILDQHEVHRIQRESSITGLLFVEKNNLIKIISSFIDLQNKYLMDLPNLS